MHEIQFFELAQKFVSKPGGVLNTAMLRKYLMWSDVQCQAMVEKLVGLGQIERAGGHFVRITDAGFEKIAIH